MIFSQKRLSGKKKLISLFLSLSMAVTSFAAGGLTASASPEAAAAGVYVKQMGRGYCTLASAVDMMRSKLYLEGNPSWPNITQQGALSTAWLGGCGLLHQFTYYGMTVTYSTDKCNTSSALISLLKQHPEGIEIYIRDLPHAVLLTRYDSSTDTFYVADPVYEGERPLMESWDRKAGSSQAAVISTIDAYWYISSYTKTTVPGSQKGSVADNVTPSVTDNPSNNNSNNNNVGSDNSLSADNNGSVGDENNTSTQETVNTDVVNDDNNLVVSTDDEIVTDNVGNSSDTAVATTQVAKSTVKLPYVNDYSMANFMDVNHSAWYAQPIKAAYEMGMMNGISDTEFFISGNVTLAQTICIAARIHSIYYNDGYDFTPLNGEPWFMPYVRYTKEKGMLSRKYDYAYNRSINYDQEALRVQFAEILSAALPADQLAAIKETAVISDVPANSDESRFQVVYQLYDAGILTGDGVGFKPWQMITRAEVAAVVSRMGDVSLRVQ